MEVHHPEGPPMLLHPRRTGSLAALASLSAVALSSVALSLPSYAAGGDRDHDGMPNRWESRHGLHPDRADGDRDRDRDGLTNLQEYRRHADPRDEDTDGDGHDDGDEVEDGSRSTRLLDRNSDDDGVLDGDEDSDHDGTDNEDEDDATEGCRGDDDDADGDGVSDEDERELGGRVHDADSDNDGTDDGEEDGDHDGESDEDEDDSDDDRCDHSDEDLGDRLGTIVTFDEETAELVVAADAGGVLTFLVTDETRIELDGSGDDSDEDPSTLALVADRVVTEVDVEDDDDPTANVLEEIELQH
jgi:hypothetical protein